MRFDLKTPCDNCPFRKDVEPYLTEGRAEQILRELIAEERTFACHKTTVEAPNGWDMKIRPSSQHCAGALILVEREKRPHRLHQIAARLGLFAPELLDKKAPVYKTAKAMLKAYAMERR